MTWKEGEHYWERCTEIGTFKCRFCQATVHMPRVIDYALYTPPCAKTPAPKAEDTKP